MHVDPLGAELLPRRCAPLGFVAGLQAGGRRFLAGIGWTATSVRQELAIPRMLGFAADAVRAVVASIDRFRAPGPGMFDDRERRLSDVFGLLVLAYNSPPRPRRARTAHRRCEGSGGPLPRRVREALPADAPTGRSTVDSIVDTTEVLAEQLLAGVVLLPILGDALAALVHDGALLAKRLILTELAKVEAEVRALRGGCDRGTARRLSTSASSPPTGSSRHVWIVLGDIAIVTVVLPSLVQSFLTGLRAFAEGVSAWGAWVADLMEKIRSVVDAFMSFDLVGFVLRGPELPPELARQAAPHSRKSRSTRLISFLVGMDVAEIKFVLDRFFDSALRLINVADHLPWVDLDNFYWRVDALAKAFDIVLTPTPPPPPDVMPTMPLAGFPDVYDAFFGGGRGATLVSSIDGFGDEARLAIRTVLGGAERTFDNLGTAFAAEADRAASMGSVGRMRELAADSAVLAERVFGPEADRQRTEAEARQTGPARSRI